MLDRYTKYQVVVFHFDLKWPFENELPRVLATWNKRSHPLRFIFPENINGQKIYGGYIQYPSSEFLRSYTKMVEMPIKPELSKPHTFENVAQKLNQENINIQLGLKLGTNPSLTKIARQLAETINNA